MKASEQIMSIINNVREKRLTNEFKFEIILTFKNHTESFFINLKANHAWEASDVVKIMASSFAESRLAIDFRCVERPVIERDLIPTNY